MKSLINRSISGTAISLQIPTRSSSNLRCSASFTSGESSSSSPRISLSRRSFSLSEIANSDLNTQRKSELWRCYYQEMLKSDPANPLILSNYAKYLHQVEGDASKAEEYYERAILAGSEDGEVLSLYGKLIWETKRDETRARSYFHQAIRASPDDSSVLGSFAHFMWETEE
ncbi:hypothetical protein M569_17256 [Genlisea aurea]|uniref:Uncharacterized protein n=1 Tax=Genlisea aurea TaxID=192259 RepID=S8DDW4_9LAMI|nr:hypothetical protein M569_17256 [Genlisea aurea]